MRSKRTLGVTHPAEVLYQRRPQEGAGILVLLVGATTGGCVAMGPFDFFQQLAHASALLMFGVVSALWVAGARKDIGGALHRTALWRALTSKRRALESWGWSSGGDP